MLLIFGMRSYILVFFRMLLLLSCFFFWGGLLMAVLTISLKLFVVSDQSDLAIRLAESE